jgi:hypothetical protein
MIGHARHREGVEHLEEQRPEPADEHGGEFAVDDARHAVDVTEGFSRIIAARRRRTVETDGAPNSDARLQLATSQCVAIRSK